MICLWEEEKKNDRHRLKTGEKAITVCCLATTFQVGWVETVNGAQLSVARETDNKQLLPQTRQYHV